MNRKLIIFLLGISMIIPMIASCNRVPSDLATCDGSGDTHVYGDWYTVKEATCAESGTKERICVCGTKENTEIPKSGHDYVTVSKTDSSLWLEGVEEKKCSKCNGTDSTVYEIVDPSTLDIPVVYISDLAGAEISLADLKKSDGEITVKYEYVSNDDSIDSFEGFSEIKIQGATSSSYPKKNFTVKLFEDEQLDKKMKVNLGWGKENKYCMKANYIDSSHARNIVGAQLFAEIVQSRENINTGLADAPNYGVIDGYPVLVYINGEFHGIYTMNIPKDEWAFTMEGDENSKEALLMADMNTESVLLILPIGETYAESGWELEYCSTDDDTWVKESFNSLIELINCDDNERIKAELAAHLDIEAAIDNMIYTQFINAADNTAKNILWVTYDGEVWIPSMYDMDGSFGIFWNGDPIGTSDTWNTYPTKDNNGIISVPGNRIYKALFACFADEIEARYAELRQDILTIENTTEYFDEFFAKIPDIAYVSDSQKWEKIPNADENRKNMYQATKDHIERLDDFYYNFNK